MKLGDLEAAGVSFEARWAGLEISGVTADSRTVAPGNLFAALSGTRTDGRRFIEAALAKGAVAVLAASKPDGLPAGIAFAQAKNPRQALARVAARLHPRQPEMIAAITGTSGKTSIAAFARQLWHSQGKSSASIGTVGVVSPKTTVYGSLTTPDPVALHATVDQLAREGVTHLAVEASSHGLDQFRLDGLRVSVGAYSNLSRDHLDYHPTMESYLAAKLRLFTDLVERDGAAVINAEDAHAPAVISAARNRGLKLLTVGRGDCAIVLDAAERDGFGQRLRLRYDRRLYDVVLPLVGAFQIENALVAAGIAIASGLPAAPTFEALARLEGAKGRLELVATHNGAPIFVDYAHKPDALSKTLEALRPYASSRLIVVFGAGGDRDQGKRPLMGAIAAEHADLVVVTDDNPRGEKPAAIRAAILAAAPNATEIGDRDEAIRRAIVGLRAGDVLVVAGKGHETGQIVGDRVLPFSDHAAVLAALKDVAA